MHTISFVDRNTRKMKTSFYPPPQHDTKQVRNLEEEQISNPNGLGLECGSSVSDADDDARDASTSLT